jgi:hypothetical protein
MHPNLDDLLSLRDGDGPPEAARHVERCVRCTEEIDELRAVASALRALPPVGSAQDHWPEIRRRIVSRRRKSRALRTGALAASIIAAVTSVVLLRSPAPATSPEAGAEGARIAIDDLTAASRGLESVLRDPALQRQVLSPRRAAVIVDLEDRIAVVDLALADQPDAWGVDGNVALWSHRVELLDALVAARTGALDSDGVVSAVLENEGSQQ